MQLGLDSYSYHLVFAWGGMDVFSFIRRAHEFGLAGATINMSNDFRYHLGNDGPAHLRKVRALAESLGLYLELFTRGTAPSHLEKSLHIAHALGCDVLRTHLDCGDINLIPARFTEATQQIRKVVPLCEQLGVRLAFENHEFETAAQCVQLVRDVGSEHVGLLLDTGNSMPIWEDPLDAMRAMLPHAVSSHFKDHTVIVENGAPRVIGLPIGRGDIDCAECFRILAGKDSPLTRINIEVCYGYSAPFRVPQERGHGAKLGEGAFKVQPHEGVWFLEPEPYERPTASREELVRRNERAVEESVAFMKTLKQRHG